MPPRSDSGGFWGGSLSAQIGSPKLYAIVGLGRTNLRTYYNLNFDPNDAITLGYARRLPDRSMLTATAHGTTVWALRKKWRM